MLDKNDLKSIKTLVGEIVAESEERIKATVDVKVEMAVEDVKGDIREIKEDIGEVKRSIDDLIETNQFFLEKFDNHEKRLTHLETKLEVVK